MSTHNTFLTLGAFILFSTLLTAFYRTLANSGDTVGEAQAGISALTYATTYMELASGLAFDEVTVDSFLLGSNVNALKSPTTLGPENPPPGGEPVENGFSHFDDLDDLNNFVIVDSTLQGISGVFKTKFTVCYVNPLDVSQISSTRTFVKRLDMAVTRISPATKDTLKYSIVTGYFHFD